MVLTKDARELYSRMSSFIYIFIALANFSVVIDVHSSEVSIKMESDSVQIVPYVTSTMKFRVEQKDLSFRASLYCQIASKIEFLNSDGKWKETQEIPPGGIQTVIHKKAPVVGFQQTIVNHPYNQVLLTFRVTEPKDSGLYRTRITIGNNGTFWLDTMIYFHQKYVPQQWSIIKLNQHPHIENRGGYRSLKISYDTSLSFASNPRNKFVIADKGFSRSLIWDEYPFLLEDDGLFYSMGWNFSHFDGKFYTTLNNGNSIYSSSDIYNALVNYNVNIFPTKYKDTVMFVCFDIYCYNNNKLTKKRFPKNEFGYDSYVAGLYADSDTLWTFGNTITDSSKNYIASKLLLRKYVNGNWNDCPIPTDSSLKTIIDLKKDKNGKLWAVCSEMMKVEPTQQGHEQGYYYFSNSIYSLENNTWKRLTVLDSQECYGYEVTNMKKKHQIKVIQFDSQNKLWILTENNLFAVNNDIIVHNSNEGNSPLRLALYQSKYPYTMDIDREDNIYIQVLQAKDGYTKYFPEVYVYNQYGLPLSLIQSTTSVGEYVYEPNNTSLLVYPNPVSSSMSVYISSVQVADIYVSDVRGERLMDINKKGTDVDNHFEITVPTETLTSGLYFVNAKTTDGKILIKQFVVSK